MASSLVSFSKCSRVSAEALKVLTVTVGIASSGERQGCESEPLGSAEGSQGTWLGAVTASATGRGASMFAGVSRAVLAAGRA